MTDYSEVKEFLQCSSYRDINQLRAYLDIYGRSLWQMELRSFKDYMFENMTLEIYAEEYGGEYDAYDLQQDGFCEGTYCGVDYVVTPH